MKRMKKFLSIILTLVMVLSMTGTAFAEQEGEISGGSITINNAAPGETYNAYQILYLESYDDTSDAYSYKANSAWINWLKNQTTYVEVDDQGYVTWVKGNQTDEEKEAAAKEFAKLAQAHAAGLSNADATVEAPEAEEGQTYSTAILSNLKLGYYLVDTTLGALCSLDTTNPRAEMTEKNEEPTVTKEVKEGKGESATWGETNDAQIGDTVDFRTTIAAKVGATNYVLHDRMTEGLTLNQDSIVVEGATIDEDYMIKFDTADECDFEITFNQSYLDKITENTNIVVTYSAVLNSQAVISTDSNNNETQLKYGNAGHTEWDKTETYTYKFDLVKTKVDDTILEGAKFELYDAETEGNKISLVKETNGDYRVATDAEKTADGFTSAVIEAGKVIIKGLDTGSYWLEETEAPLGYNKLDSRHGFTINRANNEATMDGTIYQSGGVRVINKTGSLLPSTGGIGTTIFYAAGIILMAGAVFFVIRRRKAN